MTKLARLIKAPAERKRYTVQYFDWLDAGELVSSATYQVTPATTPALSVDTSIVGSDGTSLSFYVSGGVDKQTYTLEITMNSTGGQIKEDELLFVVRE